MTRRHAFRPSRRIVATGLLSLSAAILAAGFYADLWNVAAPVRFERQSRDMEAHVVARLTQSREYGIFSAGGLLGMGTRRGEAIDWDHAIPAEAQLDMYVHDIRPATYETYASHPGGQGMLFSVLDRWLDRPPTARLDLYRALTAGLSGLALGLLVAWCYLELGGPAAGAMLLGAVASRWLTLFGGKLFWSLWAFYVPLLAGLWFLRGRRRLDRGGLLGLAGVILAGTFVKTQFTGYEYITTELLMILVPVVFYAVRYEWPPGVRRRALAATAGAAGAAVAVSLGLLVVQIAADRGTIAEGVEHIVRVLRGRTYANAADFPAGYGLDAPLTDVLAIYLKDVWLDLGRFVRPPNAFFDWYVFKIRFAGLLAGFAVCSGALFLLDRSSPAERRISRALLAATWVSLLAPLSWFVIFKSHSFVHTHMNSITWHLPFVLMGFAVVGRLAGRLAVRLRGAG